MGVAVSKDCGCLAAVSSVASTIWHQKREESHLSVLDDDEIAPPGLLSEYEIQSLLMESHEKSNNHEPV